MKWIQAIPWGYATKAKKTMVWRIVTADANMFILGQVKWFGRWRKYCFFPTFSETVFEEDCLRDIATFLEERTRAHKAGENA